MAAMMMAMVLDVRPSLLALSAPAQEAAVLVRVPGGPLSGAPEWVTARIMAGLPAKHAPPVPLSALDPAFGLVADAAAAGATAPREVPSSQPWLPELASNVWQLMVDASKLGINERDRNRDILPHLRRILQVDIVKSESDSAKHATVTDGTHCVLVAGGDRVPVINLEIKEAGGAGRPELQNVAYYMQHYFPRGGATEPRGVPAAVLAALPLVPSLQIDVHGGVALTVRGVAMAGYCVLSDVLASAHLLGRPLSPQYWALVRCLAGVREAIESLAKRYPAASPSAPTGTRMPLRPPRVYEFPGQLLPPVLQCADGATLHIFPGRSLVPGRNVFDGSFSRVLPAAPGGDGGSACAPSISSPSLCVIKLVAGCYGDAAHTSAAKAGVAPQLYGVAALPGGWTVVVMERLIDDDWRKYSARDSTQREAVRAAVKTGVHASGFVHGDLRQDNVLVRKTTDSQWTVRLLDWDWAGRAGEARYPLLRNPELAWAPGSAVCGPITAEHDEFALEQLQ
jgi:hypothetical protein